MSTVCAGEVEIITIAGTGRLAFQILELLISLLHTKEMEKYPYQKNLSYSAMKPESDHFCLINEVTDILYRHNNILTDVVTCFDEQRYIAVDSLLYVIDVEDDTASELY